jgi:hypothetical protein
VGGEDLPHADKGTHDFDVDLDRSFAPEDAGKHGHSLFGESVGQVTNVAARCDHIL